MSLADTIIAPATPAGVSALALLRLSGSEATRLTSLLLEKPVAWIPQHAFHAKLVHEKKLIDDAVVTFWKKSHSFTGDDIVEISCHGNPLIVQELLKIYLSLGARLAMPGEFTERAFLNGRLDLTQAEAVADLISAGTANALAGAQAMKEGRLGAMMQAMRSSLVDLLAHLEAYIDFPEEDIAPETGSQFSQRLQTMIAEVRSLLATAPLGRILREGVMTVIIGAPNVGKSSLLNTLLREDRAIVSPIPGTTRDTIEAECNLRGLRLRLIDTAGQRATEDVIEAEGVRRARSITEKAELILHLVENHLPPHEPEFDPSTLASGKLYLKIGNKADLGAHPLRRDALPISLKTGEGLEKLEEAIEKLLLEDSSPERQGWLTINTRQEAALRRALVSLEAAMKSMNEKAPPELISVDLRGALDEIGQVIGLTTNEDILDQLFKKFCIGK